MPTNQDVIRTVETYNREIASKIVQMDRKIDRNHRCANERFNRLESDVAELKSDVAGLKSDVAGLKSDVAGLKSDVAEIKEILLNSRPR